MDTSDGFFNVLRRQSRRLPTLAAALAAALLLAATGAWAASPVEPAVRLVATVPVPVATTNTSGGMYGYDISFVDQATQIYYLGDRSNAAVDVVNVASGKLKFITQITASPPFAGVKLNSNGTANNNISGPNGVATGVVTGGGTCLFAGDDPSRVVSFKLPLGTQADSIQTGGTTRADEMAYDPADKILVVANNAETPPFATLINVNGNCRLTIKTKVVFTFATNGAEQAVWDPTTKLFYMSIPQIGDKANPGAGQHGLVISINTSGSIVSMFHVSFCQPAGLALNPNTGELLAGCSVVFDTAGGVWNPTGTKTAVPQQLVLNASNGRIQAMPRVGSSDEVTYNAGDDHFYTGSQGSPYSPHDVTGAPLTAQGANILGVIDGTSLGLDQLVPTFGVPNVIVSGTTVHVSGSGHSVAANNTNGWVLVPAPANNAILGCLKGCIQVFDRRDNDTD